MKKCIKSYDSEMCELNKIVYELNNAKAIQKINLLYSY